MIIHTQAYPSPCGLLLLGSFNERLCLCNWVDGRHRETTENRLRKALGATFLEKPTEVTNTTRRQLDEYFHHERQTFDLPLLFVGTEFQKRVWTELFRIPYGSTISYRTMAQSLGMPKAVRAVANANGANAISIIAPCHRVIGSNGTLTGYGGGLKAKRFLLELESSV